MVSSIRVLSSDTADIYCCAAMLSSVLNVVLPALCGRHAEHASTSSCALETKDDVARGKLNVTYICLEKGGLLGARSHA